MHARFTQIKKRVAAAPGYSLLAKAVTSAVSVVKADHVQDGAMSVSVATHLAINNPFW